MVTRPFRFAASGRNRTESLSDLKDYARKVEDLGYDVLLLSDHFHEGLAAFQALAVAAQVTSHLRLGTLTAANDLRHPAMLAKDAATLDLLSEGRLELGLGTGSMDSDNRMAGLPIDPPGVRVDRLAEALRILKAYFAEPTVTLPGRHYQLTNLAAYPRGVQQPHPPILVGARGPRMLRLAAREANIISVMGGAPGDATLAEKRDIIRQAAGDRFGDIELNLLATRVQVDGQPEQPSNFPAAGYTGSRDQVVEQLQRQRDEADISYIAIGALAMEAFAPVVAKLAGQ
ncbi:MAG TPA: TIGR03621 family F420-dependent LLM class oxidoreductase [Chloroflexota bacterium]|nr:TIGR03621 family F420-dependent LLM class oxidoreductase [Chloroflexota bacterium]